MTVFHGFHEELRSRGSRGENIDEEEGEEEGEEEEEEEEEEAEHFSPPLFLWRVANIWCWNFRRESLASKYGWI